MLILHFWHCCQNLFCREDGFGSGWKVQLGMMWESASSLDFWNQYFPHLWHEWNGTASCILHLQPTARKTKESFRTSGISFTHVTDNQEFYINDEHGTLHVQRHIDWASCMLLLMLFSLLCTKKVYGNSNVNSCLVYSLLLMYNGSLLEFIQFLERVLFLSKMTPTEPWGNTLWGRAKHFIVTHVLQIDSWNMCNIYSVNDFALIRFDLSASLDQGFMSATRRV